MGRSPKPNISDFVKNEYTLFKLERGHIFFPFQATVFLILKVMATNTITIWYPHLHDMFGDDRIETI